MAKLTSATPPRKPLWFRLIGGLFYTLLCAVALILGAGAGWIHKSPIAFDIMRANLGEAIGIKPPSAKDVFAKKDLTLLILGCDEDRYYGGKQILNNRARSDMMLLAKLDFEHNRIGAISIPRDLWVDLPGYRGHKINAFHVLGGPELSKRAVEHVLDVPVDRVIVLNFEAFKEMIDLVGGVEVYVPKKMEYEDRRGGLFIDLDPGRQHLDGYKAMGFVRFRHSDSDFARAERQRDFMLAFKQSVLQNPAQFPAVVEKAAEVMGGGFSKEELAALSIYLRRIKSDNIKMGALPVVDRSRRDYTLAIDQGRLQETLEEHYLQPSWIQSASLSNGASAPR